MVFIAAIFDHTKFLSLSGKEDIFVEINQVLLGQIHEEAQHNDVIFSIMSFLIPRVVAKGYIIEFTEANVTRKISDQFVHTVLDNYWNPQLEKAIRHGILYGYFAVKYVKVDKKSNLVVPLVLNLEEYYMQWRIGKNGMREYLAFQIDNEQNATVIPQSRVFIFYEPDHDGTPSSPIQKCLEKVKQLREYWERNSIADHKNTFPNHVFGITPTKEKVIPNRGIDATDAEYLDKDLELPHMPLTDEEFRAKYSSERGIELMRALMRREQIIEENEQHYGYTTKYIPHTRKFMNVAQTSPFLPSKLLPESINLQSGAPRAIPLSNFPTIIQQLLQDVSICTGVPADVIYSGSKKFQSELQLAQHGINTTVQFWQHHLERHIVTMYLDIYYKNHMTRVDDAFTEMTRKQFANKSQRDVEPDDNGEHQKMSELIISPNDRIELEKHMTISVAFNSNPMFSFKDLVQLKEHRVLGKDNFNLLALGLFGLPASMAPTEEEERAEFKKQLEEKRLLQSVEGPKRKTPENQASQSEGKRAKTDTIAD